MMARENQYRNSGAVQMNIDLRIMLRDIRKRLWVILALSVSIALLGSVLVQRRYRPIYTTSTTYVVTSRGLNNNVYTNLMIAQQMAERFSQIITSPTLMNKVAEDMGAGMIGGTISCNTIEETNLLVLKVSSTSPQTAYLMLKSVIKNYPLLSEYLVENAVMQVLTPPTVPTEPSNSMGLLRKTLLLFLAAFVALSGVSAFLSFMGDTICYSSDIDTKLDCDNLGAICYEKKNRTLRSQFYHAKDSILITRSTVSFRYVEMLQKLSRKVRNRMDQNQAKALIITSCLENEGKSTVAANLALSLAESGKRVLLLDLDFRKPSQYRIFDMVNEKREAIGAALMGRGTGDDLVEKLSHNVYAILNTREYGQSTEMLTSGYLEVILKYMKRRFDYILIDTPPMGVSSDAEAIADIADATLIVVKEHYASARDINDMVATLNDTQAKAIGCVLNQAHTVFSANMGGYGYGTTYGYGYGYGKYYGKYGHPETKTVKKKSSGKRMKKK